MRNKETAQRENELFKAIRNHPDKEKAMRLAVEMIQKLCAM